MTEIGETVVRVDTLIRETKMFQTMCNSEIERAEEVVATGNNICMVYLNLIICVVLESS